MVKTYTVSNCWTGIFAFEIGLDKFDYLSVIKITSCFLSFYSLGVLLCPQLQTPVVQTVEATLFSLDDSSVQSLAHKIDIFQGSKIRFSPYATDYNVCPLCHKSFFPWDFLEGSDSVPTLICFCLDGLGKIDVSLYGVT